MKVGKEKKVKNSAVLEHNWQRKGHPLSIREKKEGTVPSSKEKKGQRPLLCLRIYRKKKPAANPKKKQHLSHRPSRGKERGKGGALNAHGGGERKNHKMGLAGKRSLLEKFGPRKGAQRNSARSQKEKGGGAPRTCMEKPSLLDNAIIRAKIFPDGGGTRGKSPRPRGGEPGFMRWKNAREGGGALLPARRKRRREQTLERRPLTLISKNRKKTHPAGGGVIMSLAFRRGDRNSTKKRVKRLKPAKKRKEDLAFSCFSTGAAKKKRGGNFPRRQRRGDTRNYLHSSKRKKILFTEREKKERPERRSKVSKKEKKRGPEGNHIRRRKNREHLGKKEKDSLNQRKKRKISKPQSISRGEGGRIKIYRSSEKRRGGGIASLIAKGKGWDLLACLCALGVPSTESRSR